MNWVSLGGNCVSGQNSKLKTKSRSFILIFLHNETSEEEVNTSSSTLIASKEETRNSFSPLYDENSSSEVREKLMDEKFLLRNNLVSRSPSEARGWTREVETKWKQTQFSVIPR
ncbi:hypothetical protein CEXT_233121 [Caerostris extrusa]|uniref:Uncharacterized protein n=1 Tax=Caerostris extrusa TaxID=172846 RepID=A0AAV4XS80_CAEEX|nr:hypothetical protein CEXT_233121 [Caerostris extrusa]